MQADPNRDYRESLVQVEKVVPGDVVSSESLRATLRVSPRLRELVAHHGLVVRIGRGERRIEILCMRKDS